MSSAHQKALKESRESVWWLKDVEFNGQTRKIITQNYNGPCSFIAICNILILRGDVTILPPDRKSASYDHLSQLVGEYLLQVSTDVDISAALSMMPLTQKGMDLNPVFTSPTVFKPAGDAGALKLFEQAGIQLVHGWLVDPNSPEYVALKEVEDYDSAINLIVEADHVAKGQFVVAEREYDQLGNPVPLAGPSDAQGRSAHVSDNWTEAERKKVEDAVIIRNFLDSSSWQLTYHGLFTLASMLKPGALVALFRNSHLSVLHKPLPPSSRGDLGASAGEEEDSSLYSLVTDHVFLNEPAVVWERIEDVDGASATFVDATFRESRPAGGDFAGQTAEHALAEAARFAIYDPADRALAKQLQDEEDARARELYRRGKEQEAKRARERSERRRINDQMDALYNTNPEAVSGQPPPSSHHPRESAEVQQQGQSLREPRVPVAPKMKKKSSCVIM